MQISSVLVVRRREVIAPTTAETVATAWPHALGEVRPDVGHVTVLDVRPAEVTLVVFSLRPLREADLTAADDRLHRRGLTGWHHAPRPGPTAW